MIGKFIVEGVKGYNDRIDGSMVNSAKLIVSLPQRQIDSEVQFNSGNDCVYWPLADMQEMRRLGIDKMETPAIMELDYDETSRGKLVVGVKYIKKLPPRMVE